MAFKKALSQRLFGVSRIASTFSSNCRVSSKCCSALQSEALNHHASPNKLPYDPGDDRICRRFLHRRSAAAASPDMRFLLSGANLLQKVRELDIAKGWTNFDGLTPVAVAEESPEGKLTLRDAVKLLRLSQLEMVKSRLNQIERDCVSYSEFLGICSKNCSNFDQGTELAKMLDQSGNVIVLGNIVFLRPEKVVKALQDLISVPSLNIPDSRMKEFQEMQKQKAEIDKKAKQLVQRELWCGLGYLVVQTAAFMRLTFWELSWDVMEPICFYVTSIYFMGGYAFFLRTSKEPSFEGFFQSRFGAKQRRLMEAQNFNIDKYNALKKECCPEHRESVSFSSPVAS